MPVAGWGGSGNNMRAGAQVALPPVNVTSIAQDGAAIVSWGASVTPGVIGYRISAWNGTSLDSAVSVGNVTQGTISGLTNAVAYTFTVAADLGSGFGAESSPSGVNTPQSNMVFGDDFKNTSLDPHWVAITRDGDVGNGELSYYTPAQVTPGSDVMRITFAAGSTSGPEYNDVTTVANTSGGVATITTAGQNFNGAAHGYQIGDTVVVELLRTSTQLNGTWTVTGVTANTFTFNSGYLTLISSHGETGNARCIAGGHGQVTRSYASGMVQTAPTPAFQYTAGKTLVAQVRALVPAATNMWPAIWMLGHDLQTVNLVNPDNVSSGNWNNPGSEEIDIAEFRVSDTQYSTQLSSAGTTDTPVLVTCSAHSVNWHVYEAWWSAGQIIFKLDGVTVHTTNSNVPAAGMFLLISMPARGGAVSGGPYVLQIDYVHIFNQ
jgi:hypothetical protein